MMDPFVLLCCGCLNQHINDEVKDVTESVVINKEDITIAKLIHSCIGLQVKNNFNQ